MGSDKKRDREAFENEVREDKLTLSSFYISRFPITNLQFESFANSEGYSEPRYWITNAGRAWKEKEGRGRRYYGFPFDLPNHPVVGITWHEALAFCRWLTEKLLDAGLEFQVWRKGQIEILDLKSKGFEVRLPTEAEWEKAARGTDGWIYPWGNEPDPNRANYDKTGIGTTSAVGSFPLGESPCGALDMSGNVLEWCQTKWRDSYKTKADESLEGADPRVVRGGSWNYGPRVMRGAFRDRLDPDSRDCDLGFRVVVSPGSP